MAPDPDRPVFDEDFVRGAAFTEPSARERDRTPGRLRSSRRRRAERRAERRTEKLLYGSSSGPGWRATGRTKIAAYVLIGALLAAVVGGAVWEQSGLGRDEGPSRITINDLDPDGGAGTPSVDPRDPFAGSPAAKFADGEAGVVTPEPVAMNGLTDRDLALAYHFVRKTVVAANLDPDVVYQGRHDPFTRLLDPEQKSHVVRGLDLKGDRNTRGWMTMFAPGTAASASPIIKVHGDIKVSAAARDGRRGVLAKADHLFVYAIHRPGTAASSLIRLVVRRTSEIFIYRDGPRVKFWQYASDHSPAPAECGTTDGYVHPVYGTVAAGPSPTGRPVDPYDLSRPLEAGTGCDTVVGV